MDKETIYESLNQAYFSENMHEKDVIAHLPSLLGGVSLFVDVGASLGQYTYFANRHMRNGQIVAVEPDPVRFEQLASNCRQWGATNTNEVRALNCAVSDQDGSTVFYTTGTTISGGLFRHQLASTPASKAAAEEPQWREIVVQCRQLDTLFPDRAPDLVKIDVEGAELRVLRGAKRILSEGKAAFLVELHGRWSDPEGQQSAADVVHYMAAQGYSSYNFHGRNLFLCPTRRQRYMARINTSMRAGARVPKTLLELAWSRIRTLSSEW
jgi:FkbM family methyltransferase